MRFAALVCLWLLPLVSAQFDFFGQMFGHGQQQQQQHHRGPATSQWAANADVVQCNDYLCSATLMCVQNPADCPCPSVEDEKCLVPDSQDKDAATVFCARGPEACAEIERLTHKWK